MEVLLVGGGGEKEKASFASRLALSHSSETSRDDATHSIFILNNFDTFVLRQFVCCDVKGEP